MEAILEVETYAILHMSTSPLPPCLRVLLGGRYECGFSASVSVGQDRDLSRPPP